VINTLSRGKGPQRDGFAIRRAAVELSVPCLTSLDTARAILEALGNITDNSDFSVVPLQEYGTGN